MLDTPEAYTRNKPERNSNPEHTRVARRGHPKKFKKGEKGNHYTFNIVYIEDYGAIVTLDISLKEEGALKQKS
jgi:hypothetical protein